MHRYQRLDCSLWDQLTLFEPSAKRLERARPLQLHLDDAAGNAAMVEAAQAIARMRRARPLRNMLRRTWMTKDVRKTWFLKLFWSLTPEARAEILRLRKNPP